MRIHLGALMRVGWLTVITFSILKMPRVPLKDYGELGNTPSPQFTLKCGVDVNGQACQPSKLKEQVRILYTTQDYTSWKSTPCQDTASVDKDSRGAYNQIGAWRVAPEKHLHIEKFTISLSSIKVMRHVANVDKAGQYRSKAQRVRFPSYHTSEESKMKGYLSY